MTDGGLMRPSSNDHIGNHIESVWYNVCLSISGWNIRGTSQTKLYGDLGLALLNSNSHLPKKFVLFATI